MERQQFDFNEFRFLFPNRAKARKRGKTGVNTERCQRRRRIEDLEQQIAFNKEYEF
ncbi:hypothetical protein [Photobacterium leiognathi]|uniref:hypothetical protein n=1 Tax=Photobacterium leiognathi TaxID=553611 RepID=UPI0015E7D784|nr:hypothetical protein [Photobacterium leiognathi]